MSDFWLLAGQLVRLLLPPVSSGALELGSFLDVVRRALGQQFRQSPADRMHSTPQATGACTGI